MALSGKKNPLADAGDKRDTGRGPLTMLPMWNGDYTQKFTHSFEIQPFFSNGVGAWREEDVFSLAKLWSQEFRTESA